jgi:hypothetical protein
MRQTGRFLNNPDAVDLGQPTLSEQAEHVIVRTAGHKPRTSQPDKLFKL